MQYPPCICKSTSLNTRCSIVSQLQKMRLTSGYPFLCVLLHLTFLVNVFGIHIRNSNDHCDPLLNPTCPMRSRGIDSGDLKYHIHRESALELSSRSGNVKFDRVSPTELHEIIFHVKHEGQNDLSITLQDISNPKSKNYGKYMTKDEVERVTSRSITHDYIVQYMEKAGIMIQSETLSGEHITCIAPIHVWEVQLDTEFFIYHQAINSFDTVNRFMRASSYSNPHQLNGHVESAFNTI